VASRVEHWRRRIEQGLTRSPASIDARAPLLANLVGEPSPELTALLDQPSRDAAVLVGLVSRADSLHVLLTKRAAHLPDHPGQVSFPGGRLRSPEEGPVAAALREAAEEVGLLRHQVDVLGLLPPRLTGTGFAVTPVVGWVEAEFQAVPDPSEVESVFEVPVSHLLDGGNAKQSIRERFGSRFIVHEYQFERHRIWGATAAILAEFFEVINAKTI
jgi:8-oxo-dGTP pyrophosphatase MutT (NUDIX family)